MGSITKELEERRQAQQRAQREGWQDTPKPGGMIYASGDHFADAFAYAGVDWGKPPKPFTLRGDILRTADKLTHGDRNAAYGDPVDNYRHTAAITNSILGTKLTAHEMALAMVAVKLARLAKNPGHKDSYVDAAAYLGIAYECAVARDDALADDYSGPQASS